MFWKIAWRNIWRNKRRSIIVMISVAVGIVATVLTDTLSMGMIVQMLDNQIGAHISHIQIHREGFHDNPIIQSVVPNPSAVEAAIAREPDVIAFSKRVITHGLLSSANSSSGISLVGIEPDREDKVTKIKNSLIAGRYLAARNEIVLGKMLAEKLGVGLGDKVVALASARDGRVGSDVFRIVGMYETFSSEFDKVFIYIALDNAQEMLSLGNDVSELALLVRGREGVSGVKDDLARRLGDKYEVLTYAELLPLLVMQIDIYRESMIVFYAIIGIALIFGIVNTMLMSVFERIHEFGVLMAVGMNNKRLFWMIILEALTLGLLGTVVGFIVGYFIYLPLSHSGIDLSLFSEGLKSFGSGAIIYPILTIDVVASALLIVPFIAVLGAIYPAIKAVRLQPVNAIRYV